MPIQPEAPKTHGPMILPQGSCETCEFRKKLTVISICTYVERRPTLQSKLITPSWCPLLITARDNYLAEAPRAADRVEKPTTESCWVTPEKLLAALAILEHYQSHHTSEPFVHFSSQHKTRPPVHIYLLTNPDWVETMEALTGPASTVILNPPKTGGAS